MVTQHAHKCINVYYVFYEAFINLLAFFWLSSVFYKFIRKEFKEF